VSRDNELTRKHLEIYDQAEWEEIVAMDKEMGLTPPLDDLGNTSFTG
jgi:hypothetical protein